MIGWKHHPAQDVIWLCFFLCHNPAYLQEMHQVLHLGFEWVSERVIVVNIKWEMFQLYHGEIKLHFEEMMFALYHHMQLDFHRASSLIDISLHSDTLFGFRANQSLFLLSSKYQFYSLWFYLTEDRTHILPHLKRTIILLA